MAVGSQQAEGAVFEATAQEGADVLLVFFTFVGVNADTNEVSCGFDKIGGREQTVLRSGVARSEDARDTVTLGGGRHKHDGPSAAFGFGLGRVPAGVPVDARFAQWQIRGSQILRPRAPLTEC